MKKLIAITLAIVLCAFVCVSCEEKVPGIDGYYYSDGSNPVAYRFNSNRVITYGANDAVINRGTFTWNGSSMDILWDDGHASTLSVTYSQNAGLKINGTWYHSY